MKLWELFDAPPALDEALNQPLPWQWKIKERASWGAKFTVGEMAYWVYLDGPDGGMVQVTFTDGDHREDVTGAGGAFQVFGTVADILRSFLSHRNPGSLYFTAKEPSRRALYQRLASKAAQEVGGRVTRISDGGSQGYQIVLPQPVEESRLDEDGKIIPGVNTTIDVQPGETERQAAKFGNTLDAQGRPPLLRGSYGDDSARFSANQGDPFYGENGTRLKGA